MRNCCNIVTLKLKQEKRPQNVFFYLILKVIPILPPCSANSLLSMEPLQKTAASVLMISFSSPNHLTTWENKWQPVDSNGLAMGPQLIVSHLVKNGFNVEQDGIKWTNRRTGFIDSEGSHR